MSKNSDFPLRRKVFLYAASVVAPGASDLDEFLKVIKNPSSTLSLKESLCNAFLVGTPKFDFSKYKDWLEKHHDLKRYSLLNEKSGDLIKFGMGCLIDAVSSRDGLEKAIQTLDPNIVIQFATGLADLPVIHKSAREYDQGLFKWNAFWADPQKNQAHADHVSGKNILSDAPDSPEKFPLDSQERYEAAKKWNAFWAQKSSLLNQYLAELKEIESHGVVGADIDTAKLNLIRSKTKARKELSDRYGFPTPPWESVSPNLLWNIPNLPASQASMLLQLHGMSLGYSGACGSFGAILDSAMLEIQSGRSHLAIVGAVDAAPSDELVSAFYSGRLAVIGDKPEVPFCDLRGTHISGGACVWIIAAEDAMEPFGIKPLPVEILGTGVSSDAEHIITPSREGPKLAMTRAFEMAGISSSDISLWDMHATGTPGDWNEFNLIEEFVPQTAYVSARKGIFGHGMSVGGGWELTAQLLGNMQTDHGTFELSPCGIDPKRVNPKIAALDRNLLLDKPVEILAPKDGLVCGKLSMGVGGISSCVVARILHKI